MRDEKALVATYLEHELLRKERQEPSFSLHAMKVLLAGGEEQLRARQELRQMVEEDEVLGDLRLRVEEFFHSSDRAWLNRRNLAKIRRILQLVEERQLDKMSEFVVKYFLVGVGGLVLHDTVFMPTIMSMTDEAQLAEWMMPVLTNQWIGCYAQTEMEHGSNVRGLQTTCTFLEASDELELHTPCLGAIKWWPGALGVLSTHAVVYARLLVHGKDLGIHNFLVQIRSLEDHSPMPGIEVGDIGPKWGTNTTDNGFLRFTHVRIPRRNMFMKYAKLSAKGVYSRPGPAKGSYGTMTRVRANIVSSSASGMAKAVTIALRYSAVRRQEPGVTVERPVLDYVSQQYRLLPLLATAYALHFIGKQMIADYGKAEAEMQTGDYSSSAVLHATSCSLKSVCTTLTADGIEEARRSCGGHGFHTFSGLPELYTSYLPAFTAEGDNWLLTQQTAKFLLKIYSGQAKAVAAASYLDPSAVPALLRESCSATSVDAIMDVAGLQKAYAHRSAFLVSRLHAKMQALGRKGMPEEDVRAAHLVEFYRCSRAHGLVSMLTAFATALDAAGEAETKEQQSLVAPLLAMFRLFALHHIEKDLGEFYASGFYKPEAHHSLLEEARAKQVAVVRESAILLADAFNLSDYQLHSALGCYDGRYAERLYAWAQLDPLNQGQATRGGAAIPGYAEHLKPILHSAKL